MTSRAAQTRTRVGHRSRTGRSAIGTRRSRSDLGDGVPTLYGARQRARRAAALRSRRGSTSDHWTEARSWRGRAVLEHHGHPPWRRSPQWRTSCRYRTRPAKARRSQPRRRRHSARARRLHGPATLTQSWRRQLRPTTTHPSMGRHTLQGMRSSAQLQEEQALVPSGSCHRARAHLRESTRSTTHALMRRWCRPHASGQRAPPPLGCAPVGRLLCLGPDSRAGTSRR